MFCHQDTHKFSCNKQLNKLEKMLKKSICTNVTSDIFAKYRIECEILKIKRNCSSTRNTVDSSEVKQFKEFSRTWWDQQNGPFKPLHSLNKLRVPIIRDGLINTGIVPLQNINSPLPLKGVSILDVGCGGGILTEPLARIGGDLTGLDATCDVIEAAKEHANTEKLQNIRYICSTIEEHSTTNPEKYEAVIASEVVEHVTQKQDFLKACLQCLKPGGSIFLTTLSKTCIANFGAIFLGENVFRIVPQGTHKLEKFIKPHKLQRMLEEENCKTILLHGFSYNFLSNEWCWINSTDINYALHAVKLLRK